MTKRYITLIAVYLGILTYFWSGTVFLFLTFGVIGYFIYKNSPPEDRKMILAVLIIGFLIRVFFTVTLHAANYMRGFHGISGDDLLYTIKSWSMVYKWEGRPYIWERAITGNSPSFGINPFTYILAFFYKFFGFHPVAGKIINCMIGTLIGWISYLIGKELGGGRTAKISMVIVTFYPSLIRWSVANLKDPMIIFLFAVSMYMFVVRLRRKIRLWEAALLLISMAGLYFFSHIFYFTLVLGSAGALLITLTLLKHLNKFKTFLILLTFIGFIMGTYYLFYVKPDKVIDFIYMCQEKQLTMAKSDSAGYYIYPRVFLEDINKSTLSLIKFLAVTFRSIIYFMLAPFPWRMTSKSMIISYPQMLIWYLLLMLAFFGFSKLVVNNYRAAFLIAGALIAGILVNSLAEGNVGAAFRHRDVFTPFFIIFAAITINDLISDMKRDLDK